jgi:hypothetical protein
MKHFIGIILLVTVIALSSCAQVRDENHAPKTTTELVNALKRPVTPLDMLNHIKFALDNHLLIRRDFYSDENLEHFYGGERMSWLMKKPGFLYGSVLDVKGLIDDDKTSWCSEIAARFGTEEEMNHDPVVGDKHSGGGGIQTMPGTDITAELVQSVFGTPTEIVNPYLNLDRRSDFGLGRSTHKWGNRQLIYKFSGAEDHWELAFLLRGDGTVNRINFSDWEN